MELQGRVMGTFAKATTVGLALLSLFGCEKTGAFGDATSIIAGVSSALWVEIEDTVYTALEPRIYTVRPERTFEVTYQGRLLTVLACDEHREGRILGCLILKMCR